MRHTPFVLGTLFLVVASIGGHPARAARPLGVLIVTLDTARADYLGPYAFGGASTPTLDRIASDGVVFEQASSVAPLTLPAHCSVFTGLYPPRHAVRDNADARLSTAHTTLAEVLRDRGFRTAAFVGSVVLAADRGLAQGFDVYRDVGTGADRSGRSQRPANEVVAEAVAWLEGQSNHPFFLWVHLFDAHAPYHPPEPYRTIYSDDRYSGEIAFVDSQLGRLLEALDRRQILDRTAIIVAGDHGEALGDHGETEHGIFIYESVMRVPLILRAPGIAPRRTTAVTTLVDVMPTILDLLHLPPVPVDGVSLVGPMTGTERQLDRQAYSESIYPERFGWGSLRALRDDRFKLIDAPRPELYDLQRDPFEQRNLYSERRELAAAMAKRLAAFTPSDSARSDRNGSDGPPAETLERLAALGYIGSTPRAVVSASRERQPDPKDHIAVYNARAALRHER